MGLWCRLVHVLEGPDCYGNDSVMVFSTIFFVDGNCRDPLASKVCNPDPSAALTCKDPVLGMVEKTVTFRVVYVITPRDAHTGISDKVIN